jgi:hypothetical protein
MEELLKDLMGLHEFEIFLKKEFSAENIHFWLSVQELKKLPLSKVAKKVNEIFRLVQGHSIEFGTEKNCCHLGCLSQWLINNVVSRSFMRRQDTSVLLIMQRFKF